MENVLSTVIPNIDEVVKDFVNCIEKWDDPVSKKWLVDHLNKDDLTDIKAHWEDVFRRYVLSGKKTLQDYFPSSTISLTEDNVSAFTAELIDAVKESRTFEIKSA